MSRRGPVQKGAPVHRDGKATKALVRRADRVLATKPEKHLLQMNGGCLIRQPNCAREPLQPSCPLDADWPKRWIQPQPALI